MLDVCCFGFISALRLMLVKEYPKLNYGVVASDVFGEITPDAPIVALMLSALGMRSGLISHHVGTDVHGSKLVELLAEFNIITNTTKLEDTETPYTVVACDEQNNRTWLSYLPNVTPALEMVDLELLKEAKFIYVDLYSALQKATFRVLNFTKSHNLSVYVNLAGEPLTSEAEKILYEVRPLIIQTSIDSHSTVDPLKYALEISEKIRPELTIITLAEKGCIAVSHQNKVITSPAFRLPTIHSNGAGAAFSAGIMWSYMRGLSVEQSLTFASALGGLFCTVKDGFRTLSADSITKFIAQYGKGQITL